MRTTGRSRLIRRSLLGVIALIATLLPGAATAQDSQFASPLFGLGAAPDGSVLVADTGAGIVSIRGDRRSTIPLPGVTDVSAVGTGLLWATRTGPDPTANTGQALFRVTGGNATMVVDLFAVEETDPDGQGVDSNPFDVAALDGDEALVVDAGGNDLLRVDRHGDVEVVAIFPNDLLSTANVKSLLGCPEGPPSLCGLPPAIPGQAVPTSVAVGPDGSFYVGELKGFPAPVGQSRIWRVSPDASGALCGSSPDCELVFDGGFTSIIDLTFGPDGALYVAELDEASWVAVEILQAPTGGTINRCDLDTLTCTERAGGLDILTAVTFDKHGTLWATVNALIPGLAEVVAVE